MNFSSEPRVRGKQQKNKQWNQGAPKKLVSIQMVSNFMALAGVCPWQAVFLTPVCILGAVAGGENKG